MIRRFLGETAGNFAVAFTVALVPVMGGVALAVDYSELNRQKQATMQALDASGIATAREIVSGATDEAVEAYARDFFEANLGPVDPARAQLEEIVLPSNTSGGGTLKLTARLVYKPYFLPVFEELIGKAGEDGVKTITYRVSTEIRLKNTLEVALVLDNSRSMTVNGSGTGQQRMELLKEAAKQLVDTIALQAAQMKQVDKPVQFSLVPFAASVNVGPENANAPWMDRDGRSPIHHENFDWSTMTGSKQVLLDANGVRYKSGTGWPVDEQGQKVTRFTLFDELKRRTGTQNGQPVYGPYASWGGCVETRPSPYAYDTTAPNSGTPATLFVPMFAPDETDRTQTSGWSTLSAYGNWWSDGGATGTDAARQRYMPKYFEPAPQSTQAVGLYAGPNGMCSTTPITPLTDVSTQAGLETIKDAIDDMEAEGATDVPEGIAWGWRTLSSTGPFPHGRPETERGNDKVLIVLTDGINTYYTPSSLGANDLAGNGSIYSNKGYTAKNQPGGTKTRMFMNTSISQSSSNLTNDKYTQAMNQHLAAVCDSAKAAGVQVMTVALDLNTSKLDERTAIDALRACASDSRFRKDASGKATKLFWNATGATLSDDFKEIADELSNLRIVG